MILECNKSELSDLLMFNLFNRRRTSSSVTRIGVNSLKMILSSVDGRFGHMGKI